MIDGGMTNLMASILEGDRAFRHKLKGIAIAPRRNWIHSYVKGNRTAELATTLRSIGDAVIATDRDGLITFMNPVAEGLLGWKQEEVSGKKLTDIFNIINRETRQPAGNPVYRVLREGFTVGLANHTILIARDGTNSTISEKEVVSR